MKKETQKVKGGKATVVAEEKKLAKLKVSLKQNKSRVIAGALTIVVLAGSIVLYFVHKNKTKDNGKSSANVETTTVDTIKEEEYSRELLIERINNFEQTAKENGVELTTEEVRDLATLMNIDNIVNEDPELAKELYDGKNAQDILSNAGHTIGKLMTSSFTGNYQKPMNLSTLVVGNDYDKAILAKLEAYRDELTAMRAEEVGEHRVEFATKEEEDRFDAIITDVLNFYSMTADGLEIDGNNAVIQPMADGNRFAMVLVMNEIALGNRNLLNDEQIKAFEALMANEPAVANLHRIIEGCQTKEVETTKVKTK